MVSLRWRPAAGRAVVLTDGGDGRQSPSPGRRSHATAGRHRGPEGLQRLPGWERRGHQIVKAFAREDFAHAMVFVNEVASAAEAAGHHPDIDLRWNRVTLALSSHAEGGLTERDFQLAARIQELDQPIQPA
jgi:4a-hydroxytetrahydrobiopterin dehydratase